MYLCGEQEVGCEGTGDLLAFPGDEAAAACGRERRGISRGFAVFGGGDAVVEAHLRGTGTGITE